MRTTNPSRTRPFKELAGDAERDSLYTGKRYGLIIRKPEPPVATCDETLLSCTAYGFRINPQRENPVDEHKTILSSCELDEHRH